MMNKTDLDHIETLENTVKWDYFKRVLNWPTSKVAYEMNVNERRLIEWVNARATVITKLLKSDAGRAKAIREELEKEYPLLKAEAEKKLSLNIIQVVKKYKEGNALPQLAKIFKCNTKDFRRWWNDNLPVINQEYRKER